MLNKNYLLDFISKEFPDLKNTRFNINDVSISAFTENTLLPFLIYQNTTDSKNRLIELYLEENSSSANFLPFYVAVGFYRKAVNKALSDQKFSSQKFQPEKKKVRYEADICSITEINFLSRTLQLRSGVREFELSFDEDYKLRWDGYNSSRDIKQKLDSFYELYGASQDNIFTMPFDISNRHHEGVILFSNVTKFEMILRNLKVSGNDLRQHLNIQRVVFNSDIKFQLISASKTKNKPATILVSRHDSFRALDNIIKSGNGSFDHLNTVIIDDFDELLNSWEKTGDLRENLDELNDSLFSRLGTDLKDIYLLCKNRNFSLHEVLRKNNIASLPWLISPKENLSLNNRRFKEQNISVKRLLDKKIELIQDELDELIMKWRDLGKLYFCNGVVLKNIISLYLLRDKLSSFYCPNNLFSLIYSIIIALNDLKTMWFFNNQDDGVIDYTIDFLKNELDKTSIESNVRLKELVSLISQSGPSTKKIEIITNNIDETDIMYFQNELRLMSLDVKIEYFNRKSYFKRTIANNGIPDLLVYLIWNNDFLNSAITNINAKRQVFLTNSKSFKLIQNLVQRKYNLVKNIGGTRFKYELMNMMVPESYVEVQTFGCVDFIDLGIEEKGIEEPSEKEIQNLEIEDCVKDILEVINSDKEYSSRNVKSYLVYFDDGSYLELPENKTVFYYDDHSMEDDSSIQKDVKDLIPGDLVLVPRKRAELKTILDDALNQNEKASSSLKYDNEWRYKINEFIRNRKWDLSCFRERLNENNFKIVSDHTIRNWIDGETIRPHNFKNLLDSLVGMGILTEKETEVYLRENKLLKTLKTSFVRSAVHKLIYSLKGIIDVKHEIFDEKLLNAFIDLVDIKPVSGIISK